MLQSQSKCTVSGLSKVGLVIQTNIKLLINMCSNFSLCFAVKFKQTYGKQMIQTLTWL